MSNLVANGVGRIWLLVKLMFGSLIGSAGCVLCGFRRRRNGCGVASRV